MKETILVFCAHNDDQIIGPGGTLAKYAKEGKQFKTYVFSYGVSSHIHYKEGVIIQTRIKEAYESDKIMGGSGIFYFGLKEGKFEKEVKQKKIDEKIKKIIKKEKPSKIFTHSFDDPHPDHRAAVKIITKIVGDIKYKVDVYSFDVWNPFNIRKRGSPKLVVDISKTFKTKIKAFFAHRSQKMSIFSLIAGIYLKNWIDGFRNKCKYAEVFYKIR